MSHDPVLHLLGLSKKAGRLEVGEEPVGAVCRSRHARLLLVAADAAPNTCRRASHFGQAGNVLWLPLPHTKQELGLLLGRKSCAMLAITDFGLAAAVAERLARLDPERYGPAAQQLRERADRALQRQKEKIRHEKKLRQGIKKPWVPPSKESRPAHRANASSPGGRRRAKPAGSAPGEGGSSPHPRAKAGPGGKKLTAKPLSPGRRPSGTKP